MMPALPVSGSTWTSTELNTTGPRSSVVKRVGSWLRKDSTTDRVSMPRMESRGPTMPTPVQVPGERCLLARRLGVHVDDDDAAVRQLRQRLVGGAERAVQHSGHERAADKVDHGDAVAGDDAATGRALRVVQRAQQRRLAVQVGVYLAVVPDMVAGRDDLDAGLEHLVGGAGRQPLAPGRGLAVGDDEVNAVAAPDAGQNTSQGPASHLPHHIADHKYVH